MKLDVIKFPWSDEDKVLAVAIAPKEPLRQRPHIHPLNTFVPYGHTAKQADPPLIAASIDCKHQVSVIGFHTSCMVKGLLGGGRWSEGNHPPASSWKNCPRMTCKEAST
jgi:hypothetical protein